MLLGYLKLYHVLEIFIMIGKWVKDEIVVMILVNVWPGQYEGNYTFLNLECEL